MQICAHLIKVWASKFATEKHDVDWSFCRKLGTFFVLVGERGEEEKKEKKRKEREKKVSQLMARAFSACR
jgi:hypothetical protein